MNRSVFWWTVKLGLDLLIWALDIAFGAFGWAWLAIGCVAIDLFFIGAFRKRRAR